MLHYFYGEDTYRAREAVARLAEEEKANVRWLDRQDFAEQSPADVVGQGSRGLFGQELIVVRDVSVLPKGLQEDLLSVLELAGQAVSCVLWDRGKIDRRSVMYKRLKMQAEQFNLPSPREAQAWLVSRAKMRGGQIKEEAAQLLVERLGVDRWRLASELDKLLLVSDRIDGAAVRRVVPPHAAAEIFAMLDALARGQRKLAVRSVEALLAAGDGEFYVLSMLAYQFRTLLTIRLGIDRGWTQLEIIKQGKLKPYSVQKNYPHARRFSQGYLRDALTRVLVTDFAIRRGKVDQRTALVMLVLNLVSQSRV